MFEIYNYMDGCWFKWKVNIREKKGSKRFFLYIVFEVNGYLIYNYCFKINKVVEKKIEFNFYLILF